MKHALLLLACLLLDFLSGAAVLPDRDSADLVMPYEGLPDSDLGNNAVPPPVTRVAKPLDVNIAPPLELESLTRVARSPRRGGYHGGRDYYGRGGGGGGGGYYHGGYGYGGRGYGRG